MWLIFLLLTWLLPLSSAFQLNPQQKLIASCLDSHRPSFAVLFLCWKRRDKVKMHKMIRTEGLMDVRLAFLKAEAQSLGKVDTKKHEKFSYFLDLETCSLRQAETVLQEAAFGKLHFLYSWFLLMNADQSISQVEEVFRRLKTRMDMDVKIFHGSRIFELYNPGINVGLKRRLIEEISGLSYYDSRRDMKGVIVRSSNVIRYPFKTSYEEYMLDPKLMKYDIYSKFHYQLFLCLAEIHGFSFNTTLAVSWFGNTSSGEDGGLAKYLWEDIVDISSAGCIMRLLGTERIDFYDFIMPYYKFRSYFYFRNPGVVKPNFGEVLKPFSAQTWIITLCVTGLICLAIEVTYLVKRGDSFWYRSVFIVVAAFSQQGLDNIPASLPSRIILLHLLFCSVLLYNYYTSSLVSSLISTEPEVLKSIQELLESRLKVGIEYQPYTITYMLDRVKNDRFLDALNKTKIYQHDVPNMLTAEKGIEMVRLGGFAFHTESITAYPLIGETFEQESICDLAEIALINSDTSLMAQKRSQYKKLFQVSLRKMWQSGIIKKLHKTWVTRRPECLSSARVKSVGVNDLFLPYFLLVMGVAASLLILAAEITWMWTKTVLA
ncbi:ionotropic receptor 75a-like [Euwallacea similis]|uniref:ionotropic receptor 75a-like n=1 Tax=Euwallacea similis TaxID=1736056 RepID=UPI00344DE268